MRDSVGGSVMFGFRVPPLSSCFLSRNKVRWRCLALCFVLVVGLTLLSKQDGYRTINCAVKYTIHPDYFSQRSVEIMNQRVGDLNTDFTSEILYYYDYVKPTTSFCKSSDNDFQPVEENSSYVYSAYLDDREAPDVDSRALPVVRIFTALPRDSIDRARRTWHCLFWYEAVDLPLVVPVTGITDLDTFDTWRTIMCTMVLCSVPTISTSNPPIAVSLVSDICQGPQNHLTITDMRKLKRNFEGLSSTSNDAIHVSSSHTKNISNFTICIPPLFGDFLTTAELIEFVEVNRILGASRFVFYLESPKEEILSCVRYYSRVGLMELNNWSLPFNLDDINYHGQILSQNECLYRTMYRTKFLTNQDFDEFITPSRTETWKEMLDLIHKNDKPKERDKTASYSFRNLFFPLDTARDSSVKKPSKVGEYKFKTLSNTMCLEKSNPWGERSKVMGRPERLLIWHVHQILRSSLVREGDFNAMVDESDGRLFHYRELGPEYSRSAANRRMWIYQKELVDRVKQATLLIDSFNFS